MDSIQNMTSFVENSDNSLFSMYNLPYGVFCRKNQKKARIGTAIGEYVLDLTLLEQEDLLNLGHNEAVFQSETLNTFAACGPQLWAKMRTRIQSLLSLENYELQDNSSLIQKALIPMREVEMQLPFNIGAFTDFYASEQHATNVGKLFRPNEHALLPNWKHLPVAYNGRASTVFASGTTIKRPNGQIKAPDQEAPVFLPTKKLDFELELGFFVGVGNPDGQPIAVGTASEHIFGLVLLNDWSARDIQAFEYQPLGPFLSKSFATSISPWVVPLAALQTGMAPLGVQNPKPLPYLYQERPMQPDIRLQVAIKPRGAKTSSIICDTSSKELYWSMEQMLAHHTVNNCIMRTGDLLGTGTISGAIAGSWGSLLEASLNGKQAIKLADGSERTFLEDGDAIIISGYCQTANAKIGFGTLEGTII
ncbi:MAG: fumarylacetoacetase [Legionella sp.]